jgi:hypothetical protein
MHLFSRSKLQSRLTAAFADPERLRALLQPLVQVAPEAQSSPANGPLPLVPTTVVDWLSRLTLLQGVPFQYLAPDEAMLPPESIRFFYLNMNWIDALVDGALSLGRNLTSANSSASETLDKAIRPQLTAAVKAHAGNARRRALGLTPQTTSLQVVSGFLLRSTVVEGYPGLGVNAYPLGGTPNDPTITLLPILRLEQLGPQSGVLLCLIDGDAARVDVHEPPEGLHYGLDTYSDAGGTVSATKSIYTFTRNSDGHTITMASKTTPLDGVAACFRPASPRVLMYSSMAGLIATANNSSIDSAEMGFEMTEGVGQVSFLRRSS